MEEKSKYTEEDIWESDLEPRPQGVVRGPLIRFLESPYYVAVIMVSVTLLAFFLGRWSAVADKKEPVRVIDNSSQSTVDSRQGIQNTNGAQTAAAAQGAAAARQENSNSEQVVGSKNSTKYHYPWCSGAKRISAQNLVTFSSIEDARAAGYEPAANCPGLQ